MYAYICSESYVPTMTTGGDDAKAYYTAKAAAVVSVCGPNASGDQRDGSVFNTEYGDVLTASQEKR